MDSIPGGEDTDKVRCCLDSKGFPASRDSYGQKPFIAHQVSCFGGRTVSFFLLLGTNTGWWAVLVDKILRLNTKMCLVMCGLSIRISH